MQPSNIDTISQLLNEIDVISDKIRFHLVENSKLDVDSIAFLEDLYSKKGNAIKSLDENFFIAKTNNIEINDGIKTSLKTLIEEDKHLLGLIEERTQEMASKVKISIKKKNLLIYKR